MGRLGLLLGLFAVLTPRCADPPKAKTSRETLELFGHHALGQAEQGNRLLAEIAQGAKNDSASVTYRELARFLVPILGLQYRMRNRNLPDSPYQILVQMELLPKNSAARPVSVEDLERILNRATLPETELLLPHHAPLPQWLAPEAPASQVASSLEGKKHHP